MPGPSIAAPAAARYASAERERMTPWVKYAGVALAGLAAGFAAGWAAHRLACGQAGDRAAFVERRAGPFRHVNPLLDCDLADDVLRNQELLPFKAEVERLLLRRAEAPDAPRVAVYFRELDDGLWFAIGDTERFTPASLRKLPMMVALLKAAEGPAGRGLLDREVPFELGRDHNAGQNVKPSEALAPGARYPVRELIRRMIALSDNNAFALLAKVVDPDELDRAYALLRMQNPRATADDGFLSVQTYASFFRILYNATYLSREASEWALATLAQSEFRAGLVAGLPAGVHVAHKFGEKSDAPRGAFELHDCGIVYYPGNPYLLCVMSSGRSFEELDDEIAAVSRLVWQQVSAQLGGRAAAR
jgi:beta-lactamase class A